MKDHKMRAKICFKSMGSNKIKHCEGNDCIAAIMTMKKTSPEDNEYTCILLKN